MFFISYLIFVKGLKNDMNIQSTIEFLKLLGFKLVIDNNKMIFYDSETNDMIESFYNNVPLLQD